MDADGRLYPFDDAICSAQSVKPEDDAWLKGELRHPPNHLINVSEDAVKELLPKSRDLVAKHNAKHLVGHSKLSVNGTGIDGELWL